MWLLLYAEQHPIACCRVLPRSSWAPEGDIVMISVDYPHVPIGILLKMIKGGGQYPDSIEMFRSLLTSRYLSAAPLARITTA